MGLGVYRLLWRPRAAAGRLRGADWAWLGAAILAGGVIAPVLLMTGLAARDASEAGLLLNLAGVFTALIAWVVFREHVDARIALGMAAIGAGALALAWAPGPIALDPAVLIVAACLAWAIDNNLTRQVSGGDPVQIAALKGLVAGAVNVTIGLAHGVGVPGARTIAGAAVVGVLGYGLSLVLFIVALRQLGTGRASAYFSTAPFVSAIASVVALGEPVTARLGVAAALMAAGVALHVSERHEHEHTHGDVTHAHPHYPDVGHRHRH